MNDRDKSNASIIMEVFKPYLHANDVKIEDIQEIFKSKVLSFIIMIFI